MRDIMLKIFDFLAPYGLDKLPRALMFGGGLVVVLAVATGSVQMSLIWLGFLFRWLHVGSGIMWIGLLWYFNFVQIPSMPKIPDDQKPAISKVIAPAALFWFRWAALATVVTGIALFVVGPVGNKVYIGIGMALALVMAFNVWNIIWPNQQKVLGLVEATAEEKQAAARAAMLASRFNTMFSIPMLYFMVAAQNLS